MARNDWSEFQLPAVIASEAKQSRNVQQKDWIASSPSAPRNDASNVMIVGKKL
jgi:hypothetical protein